MSNQADDRTMALVVDLDGTLISTDSLVEGVLALIKRNPLLLFMLPIWWMRGRPQLKKNVCRLAPIDASALPYNQAIIEKLTTARAEGRRTILATASDELTAEAVAGHLDLFDDIIASDGKENLRGDKKLNHITSLLGKTPFAYAGDSSTDLPLWTAADHPIMVDAPASLKRKVRAERPGVEIIDSDARLLPAIVKEIRPHQWVKNLLIFVPLFLAHEYLDTLRWLNCLIAFGAFSLVASSIYVINDLFDLNSDRHHPRKRNRPLASGALPIGSGIVLAFSLMAFGAALTSMLSVDVRLVLVAYVVLTTLYSIRIKRMLMLDIVVLAGLYTIRVVAGAEAAAVWLSPWALGFSMFIFLSLASAKRYTEVYRLRADNQTRTRGRGYVAGDTTVLAAIGAASSMLSVLVFALYLNSQRVTAMYTNQLWLWMICPLLIYWLGRFWLLTTRGDMHDDPVVFALKDKSSYFVALLAILLVLVAV
jgi:4-hydroxybenzoate polyprenyltransferase